MTCGTAGTDFVTIAAQRAISAGSSVRRCQRMLSVRGSPRRNIEGVQALFVRAARELWLNGERDQVLICRAQRAMRVILVPSMLKLAIKPCWSRIKA